MAQNILSLVQDTTLILNSLKLFYDMVVNKIVRSRMYTDDIKS